MLRKAFKIARLKKTGAIFIEFPEDVARLQVAARALRLSQTLQRSSDVDLSNPDFVEIAESYGAAGYRVSGPDSYRVYFRKRCCSRL